MAKSDRSSQNPQPPHHASSDSIPPGSDSDRDDTPEDITETDQTSTDRGQSEAVESREERLARIRREIDEGTYDSDDLLEQALEIMIRKVSGQTE